MLQDRKSLIFLAITKDMSHKEVNIFRDENNIFLCYDIDTDEEYITSKDIKEIQENQDKYLWTPYIEAITFIKN